MSVKDLLAYVTVCCGVLHCNQQKSPVVWVALIY